VKKENNMSNKKIALQKLVEYFDEYVNLYGASQPGWVKTWQYFIDWVKTANEDVITTCQERTFSIRRIDFLARLYGWKTSGDTRWDREFDSQYSALIVTDPELTKYVSNFISSPQAGNKMVPGNLSTICDKVGREPFKEAFPDFIYSKAILKQYDITDPVEQTYLFCTVTYPFKEKQLNFSFIIYEDRAFMALNNGGPKRTGGCYVATAVYGSYDCPQVWTLRRYRDETLARTWYGRLFIKLYYKISPRLVAKYGNTSFFQRKIKARLDKMVAKLNEKGFDDTPYYNE
jgi:hypothetical protein